MNKNEFMHLIYSYEKKLGTSENMLHGNLLPVEDRTFLLNNANAFLYGLISDQSVKAEIAWSLPYKLMNRMGYFDLERFTVESSIEEFIEVIKKKPALHRYPKNIGKYLWLAAEKVHLEYGNDASNIWRNVEAKELISRLEDFKGISHKKAALGCLLLIRDFGLDVPDKENVNIIYDIHIRRIMLRAGFSQKDTYQDIINAGKMLYPEFPGYLTSTFWAIGREICRPTKPLCEKCPIEKFCKKKIELGADIHA